MRKILCLLVLLGLAVPVAAADNSPVVMNVKTYIYRQAVIGLKDVQKIVLKQQNKRLKPKGQSL